MMQLLDSTDKGWGAAKDHIRSSYSEVLSDTVVLHDHPQPAATFRNAQLLSVLPTICGPTMTTTALHYLAIPNSLKCLEGR